MKIVEPVVKLLLTWFSVSIQRQNPIKPTKKASSLQHSTQPEFETIRLLKLILSCINELWGFRILVCATHTLKHFFLTRAKEITDYYNFFYGSIKAAKISTEANSLLLCGMQICKCNQSVCQDLQTAQIMSERTLWYGVFIFSFYNWTLRPRGSLVCVFNLLTSCWKHNLNKDCTFSVNFPLTLYALCDHLKFYCMTLLYPKSDRFIIQCSVRGQSECLQSGRGCWTRSIWWHHMDKSLGSSCQKISIPQ